MFRCATLNTRFIDVHALTRVLDIAWMDGRAASSHGGGPSPRALAWAQRGAAYSGREASTSPRTPTQRSSQRRAELLRMTMEEEPALAGDWRVALAVFTAWLVCLLFAVWYVMRKYSWYTDLPERYTWGLLGVLALLGYFGFILWLVVQLRRRDGTAPGAGAGAGGARRRGQQHMQEPLLQQRQDEEG